MNQRIRRTIAALLAAAMMLSYSGTAAALETLSAAELESPQESVLDAQEERAQEIQPQMLEVSAGEASDSVDLTLTSPYTAIAVLAAASIGVGALIAGRRIDKQQ